MSQEAIKPSVHEEIAAAVQGSFPELLARTRAEGFPAYLAWSQELADGSMGYVVESPKTRRVLAVKEQQGTQEPTWFAQAFRVRRDENEEATFSDVCLEMMEELTERSVSQGYIEEMTRKLFVGYGMFLQYPSVVLECNDPVLSDGYKDAQSISLRDETELWNDPSLDLGDAVRAVFENEVTPTATTALDMALHMVELPQWLHVDGEGTVMVYRSRLADYLGAQDSPRRVGMMDVVLIKVNDGSLWYASKVELTREIDRDNVIEYMRYTDQILSSDVLPVLIRGVRSCARRVHKINSDDSCLMTSLLDQQHYEDESEANDSFNPYNLVG